MITRKKLVGRILDYKHCYEIHIQGYNAHRCECEWISDYDCHYSDDSIAVLDTHEFLYKYKDLRVEYYMSNKREITKFDEIYYWRKVSSIFENVLKYLKH